MGNRNLHYKESVENTYDTANIYRQLTPITHLLP